MRSGSGRPRWVPVIAVTLVLVVLMGVGYVAWTFGGIDPGAIPSRLHIYGRTYRAAQSGVDLTASGVASDCPLTPCPGVLEPVLGYWPLVLPWDRPSMPGEWTLMRVYLRIAPDRYRAYGIVGGP
jgi:hypothetical protein